MTYDEFLREACPVLDLVWRKYRRRAARHRVDERLKEIGLHSYREYLDLLRRDPLEAALLPDRMRITVTRFFRDAQEWHALKDVILPSLVAESGSPRALRAWSAGCCGGEEPYTLALIWLAYLGPLYPAHSLRIIATDIDDASLDRARSAVYRTETLREIPPEIRSRWFTHEKRQWRVDEKAAALVTFSKSNLLDDPPPVGMDLVLCRYLALTYFRGSRLHKALRNLWEALRPGGVLMIGAKEEFPASGLELFEPIAGCRVFFRRRKLLGEPPMTSYRYLAE